MNPLVLITIGLLLDMIGVVLIWKFGLGQPLYVRNREGKGFAVGLGKPKNRFLWVSLDRLGLLFLIFGFAFQLIGNWIPQN